MNGLTVQISSKVNGANYRNLSSEPYIPNPQTNVNTENDRINNESKGLDGMSTELDERRDVGKVEKGSWWEGMSIWAKGENEVGRGEGKSGSR